MRVSLISALIAVVLGMGWGAGAQQGDEPAQFPLLAESERESFRVEQIMDGLNGAVSMVFLPDGSALLAERAGARITRLEDGKHASSVISGLPAIFPEYDAGIFELALHPNFNENGWIYMAYSVGDKQSSTIRLARFRLSDNEVADFTVIYSLSPVGNWEDHWYHYGGRIVFHEGYLFLTIGDRHNRHLAQAQNNAVGTILRMTDRGDVPADNPFVGVVGVDPLIWSFGHRNPQGLTVDPSTGVMWSHEHGPLGGDELNIILKGKNYGWPTVTWGKNYDGTTIGEGKTNLNGMENPVFFWSEKPSGIAPSDMLFYQGDQFPEWKGSLFLGSMSKTHLRRLVIEDNKVVHEEVLLQDEVGMRVRMVREAPDGSLYLGVDSGMLLRVSRP